MIEEYGDENDYIAVSSLAERGSLPFIVIPALHWLFIPASSMFITLAAH